MKNQLLVIRAWVDAHSTCAVSPSLEILRVLRCYRGHQDADRYYHTIDHIASCLRFAEQYRCQVSRLDFAILTLALIYHDLVYDVRSHRNEIDSAIKWREYAIGRFCSHVTDTVADLIEMTKDHRFVPCGCGNAHDRLGPIMMDCDMHILAVPFPHPFREKATPWNSYMEYAKAVRREYSIYSLDQYVAGRTAFLNSVDPEKLFYTTEMLGSRTIAQVRENIKHELHCLQEPEKFFGEKIAA